MAIVVAKGPHLKRLAGAGLRILVPVSGSAVSRRGAEVAIALAHVSPDPLRVVYVSTTRDKGSATRPHQNFTGYRGSDTQRYHGTGGALQCRR
jgi:hypothetical protein